MQFVPPRVSQHLNVLELMKSFPTAKLFLMTVYRKYSALLLKIELKDKRL